MKELQYPIGTFQMPAAVSQETMHGWIYDIYTFPAHLQELLAPLDTKLRMSTYRPGGWTIMQIVHHCADSHMNAFIRCKLALSEDNPTIKDYLETAWAKLPDATLPAPEVSLALLSALHQRWGLFFENLSEDQLRRTYFHPGHQRTFSLKEVLGMYSWHGRHHLAHIRLAIDQAKTMDIFA
jgi:hypothetical protein